MAFAWSQFARDDYCQTVGIINALNRNSKRAIAKVGTGTTRRFWYFRFLGFTYYSYQGRRGVGRWSPRNRLEVALGERWDESEADSPPS